MVNANLEVKCNSLVENRNIINKTFAWESDYMRLSAAGLFTSANVKANGDKLKEMNNILKKAEGVFSTLRGNVRLPLLSKMALSNNPSEYLEEVSKVYKMISKGIFGESEYKIIAAMIIIDSKMPIDETIVRMEELYKKMSKKHGFLTSSEDYPMCAALAVTNKDIDELISDMEESFKILKGKFMDQNAVQSLTHVLALDSKNPEEKCARVISIFDSLKKQHHKFGTGLELSILGLMQMLNSPEDEVIGTIIEADEYLKKQKGFGNFTLGSDLRRIYAAQITIDLLANGTIDTNSVMIENMLLSAIQLEIILMICILSACSSSAAASSATN